MMFRTIIDRLFVLLLLTLSCSVLVGCQTAKSVGDRLERFPIGISAAEMDKEAPELGLRASSTKRVGRLKNAFIAFNPLNKAILESLALYRQWPNGVLLGLKENDWTVSLKIYEGSIVGEPQGQVQVFFTPELRYKGYWAYSCVRFAQDSKERFSAETKAFKDLGMLELALREKERTAGKNGCLFVPAPKR